MDSVSDMNKKVIFTPILSNEYTKQIKMESVFVGIIPHKEFCSTLIYELSRCLPIPSLRHLKRINGEKLMICKLSDITGSEKVSSLDKLIEQKHKGGPLNWREIVYPKFFRKSSTPQLDDGVKYEFQRNLLLKYLTSYNVDVDVAKMICDNTMIMEVPASPPILRWQYVEANRIWPCKFHSDPQMETVFRCEHFSKEEIAGHQKMISILMLLTQHKENAGLCVDPKDNSIVAVATNKTKNVLPIEHCPMTLLDFVSRTQGGGFYEREDKNEFCEWNCVNGNSLAGIRKKDLQLISMHFPDVNLGVQVNRFEKQKCAENKQSIEDDGPYLCTGYTIYLCYEPCFMCAMALLHSRIEKIFYLKESKNGGISHVKLHTIKDLNHKFDVYKCELE